MANTAAKQLEEMHGDWETWTTMDHPKTTNAHQWIQQYYKSHPSAIHDVYQAHEMIDTNVLFQSVRARRLSNGQWFAWLSWGVITGGQWQAYQTMEGSSLKDESTKLYFPFPNVWSLGPPQSSVRREI